jgi:hypothetical protein
MKKWREIVTIHPAANMFPPIGDAELRELADDIKANGLHERVKVIVSDNKQVVIDGRNRLDAMELAGMPIFSGSAELNPEIVEVLCHDEFDPVAFVIGVNIRRRHLTNDQKRDLVALLLKMKPERSNHQTAIVAAVDDKTVASVRRELEGRSEIQTSTTTIDTKGRRQPTKKPARQAAPKASASVKAAADRAEPKSSWQDLSRAVKKLVEEKRVDGILGLLTVQRYSTEALASMSHDARIGHLAELAQANTWLNERAVEVAIAGGAKLGVLSPPNLRYEAISFMRKAIAKIEAELAGREVKESTS